jgi:ABC-type Zn uptake system ZnuABC Zn-binding protein ZnuA
MVDEIPDADPHWWQDPRSAAIAAGAIRDALIEADPAGRGEYRRNAAAYVERLRSLDDAIAGCWRHVQPAMRKLVTSHDSFGAYADRYGLEVVGAAIPALSTEAQPSAGEVAALVERIRAEVVTAIFPESGVDPGLEESIAADSGAAVGGELWADALGPEGSDGATYLEALAANTETLIDGITGGRLDCSIELPAA